MATGSSTLTARRPFRWACALGFVWVLQAPFALRSAPRTVALFATVHDRDGRLVPDLTQADFTVQDDGKPVEITVFSNAVLLLTGVFMIDMSDAAVNAHPRVQAAAAHFVQALSAGDRVRIGTFGQEIALNPLLTGDKAVLQRIVEEELWPGGPRPLWLASRRAMESLAGEVGRLVVFVLSHGPDLHDNADCPQSENHRDDLPDGCVSAARVRQQAESGGFMVYAVGAEGSKLDADLAKLAEDTGGAAFQVTRDADLDAALDRVIEELHHQYVLGFTPAAPDGKTHRLEVTLTNPGLTIRARKSYVAGGK